MDSKQNGKTSHNERIISINNCRQCDMVYSNGEIKTRYHINNEGKRHGPYTLYFRNGPRREKIMLTGNYKNGKRHGVFTLYAKYTNDHIPYRTYIYSNDVCIHQSFNNDISYWDNKRSEYSDDVKAIHSYSKVQSISHGGCRIRDSITTSTNMSIIHRRDLSFSAYIDKPEILCLSIKYLSYDKLTDVLTKIKVSHLSWSFSKRTKTQKILNITVDEYGFRQN